MSFRVYGRLCIAVVLVMTATPAIAQVCRAGPSFITSPYQVEARAAFTDGGRTFGGDFGVGGRYLFATAGVSSRYAKEPGSYETAISTRVGVELLLDRGRRVYFCPSGFLSFGTGPDIGALDVSTFRVGAGGRVGVGVYESPSLMVVPTLGIDLLRERRAFEIGGVEEDEADGVGNATIGVGFIINRQFAIVPEFFVPFSAADSDVTVGVRFAFGFGGTGGP